MEYLFKNGYFSKLILIINQKNEKFNSIKEIGRNEIDIIRRT